MAEGAALSRDPSKLCAPLAAFAKVLLTRALRGEEVVVHGPRGVGKTSVILELRARLEEAGVSVGHSAYTRTLADVVSALSRAFPEAVRDESIPARWQRGRLRMAVEQRRAVLLLDHVETVTSPMRSFLRKLRGKALGVVFAVDVDSARDRARLNELRLTHHHLAFPRVHGNALRAVFQDRLRHAGAPAAPDEADVVEIVRAAEGRPGWVVECASRLRELRYWNGTRLRLGLLRADVAAELLGRYLITV